MQDRCTQSGSTSSEYYCPYFVDGHRKVSVLFSVIPIAVLRQRVSTWRTGNREGLQLTQVKHGFHSHLYVAGWLGPATTLSGHLAHWCLWTLDCRYLFGLKEIKRQTILGTEFWWWKNRRKNTRPTEKHNYVHLNKSLKTVWETAWNCTINHKASSKNDTFVAASCTVEQLNVLLRSTYTNSFSTT